MRFDPSRRPSRRKSVPTYSNQRGSSIDKRFLSKALFRKPCFYHAIYQPFKPVSSTDRPSGAPARSTRRRGGVPRGRAAHSSRHARALIPGRRTGHSRLLPHKPARTHRLEAQIDTLHSRAEVGVLLKALDRDSDAALGFERVKRVRDCRVQEVEAAAVAQDRARGGLDKGVGGGRAVGKRRGWKEKGNIMRS